MHKKAFTLVEIMIVVLILGILALIAIPGWMNARDSSRQKTCLSNLRAIADAKEEWAMDTRQPDGGPCTQNDIWPTYIKGTQFPSCPTAGVYTIGNVGQDPTCSYQAGNWPHTFPTN